jgi:hypothetical protein
MYLTAVFYKRKVPLLISHHSVASYAYLSTPCVINENRRGRQNRAAADFPIMNTAELDIVMPVLLVCLQAELLSCILV